MSGVISSARISQSHKCILLEMENDFVRWAVAPSRIRLKAMPRQLMKSLPNLKRQKQPSAPVARRTITSAMRCKNCAHRGSYDCGSRIADRGYREEERARCQRDDVR